MLLARNRVIVYYEFRGFFFLRFEFIKLGLDSVLYNPKTKEIYTPNTDKISDLKNTGKLIKDGEKEKQNN